ncbi:GILT-like protein 1 [Anopheles cruzii]|uniref:GILT-like protein 1 n=1 Tax=Anopheles cruzii TaxID=68878 RepID=UPI0022EC7416|nr:GILT-like protein 1 [Anopheles cruzii]
MLRYNRSFLLLSVFAVACYGQTRVPVYVYYESLCPDSAKFVNDQLYPAAKMFKNNLELHLVPFGKSSFQTQGSEVMFTCHHGENECYGNKVHACAIQHIQGNSFQPNISREDLTLDYVNCLMARAQLKDGEFPTKICADVVKIEQWQTIEECAKSTEGSQLLKQHGETTNKLQNPLTSVPTVAFKQTYDGELQKLSMSSFRHALCKNLNPQPVQCFDLPGSASAMSSFGFFITVVAAIASRMF